MKKPFYLILLGLLLVIICFTLIYSLKFKMNSTNLQNCNVVMHLDQSSIKGSTQTTNIEDLKSFQLRMIFEEYGIKEIEAVFKNRYNTMETLKRLNEFDTLFMEGWQEVKNINKVKAEDLVKVLSKIPGVSNVYIEKPLKFKPAAVPTDGKFISQWHLRSLAFPNAHIRAVDAWDINKGRNDIIIAVCIIGVGPGSYIE